MTSETVGERDSIAGYGREIGVSAPGQQQTDQFVVTCTHKRFDDPTCFVSCFARCSFGEVSDFFLGRLGGLHRHNFVGFFFRLIAHSTQNEDMKW